MIRSGVVLKKVETDLKDDAMSSSSSSAFGGMMDARSQLHTTLMNKISHGVRGMSPESDDNDSENDEFDD